MGLSKVLFNLLSNDAAVSAVVGTRIFPLVAPQEVNGMPFITYIIDSVEPENTKEDKSEIDTYQVNVDAWATSHLDAEDLSGKIRTALDRYRGTVEGVVVDKFVFTDYDQDFDDFSKELYNHTTEFEVRVKR